MSLVTAEFFAFPEFTYRNPDNPSRKTNYLDLDDPTNPFKNRYFINTVQVGEASSLAAMEIEWAARFGNRPFSFCSLSASGADEEITIWKRHELEIIDYASFDAAALFRLLSPPDAWASPDEQRLFKYLFARLSSDGNPSFTAWLCCRIGSRCSAFSRDMLGFSVNRAI